MLANKDKKANKKKTKDKYLCAFFLVYMVALFRITVFRSNFSLFHVMENGTINLSLFQDYIPFIRQGRWFLFLYLFVGNIIWFVPFGSMILLSGKVKGIWGAALCGLLLSFIIETLQYIFGTGVSELDDLVLNTMGAGLGAAVVRLYRHYQCRLGRKREVPQASAGQNGG